MGILNFGTFPSVADATRAACAWGVAAHRLNDLAVLMNKTDPASVNVTLARRDYYRTAAFELPPDVLARLDAQDSADSLLVLVASQDCASHVVLTLEEMKEALK